MIRYALYLPAMLLFDLLVILTCWFWAAWAAYTPRKTLPEPFDLVHTHDDDIYGSKTTGDPVPGTWRERMKRAMWWLCRNPGYGLDAKVLGFRPEDVAEKATVGPMTRFVLKDGSKRFGYKRDTKTVAGWYLKMWFGWHDKPKAGYHKLKFAFTPKKAD